MSRANVPRWQLICGALVIRSGRLPGSASTPVRSRESCSAQYGTERRLGSRAGRARCWVLRERALSHPLDRPAPPRMRRCADRDRPYLENCTVDASINCSRQVNKGTRWMPWHQEPKKDVGACDKPREVGNQTLIRGFPNRET